MNNTPLLLFIFSIFGWSSLLKSQSGEVPIQQLPTIDTHSMANEFSAYIIGKKIHVDSVSSPKKVRIKSTPTITKIINNVHPIGTPKVIPTQQPPESILIDTSKVKKVVTRGKSIPAIHPKSVPALFPQLNEAATYDLQQLSIEQGLANTYITYVYKDKKDIIWFSTHDGAVKYDGKNLTTFTTKEGLCHNLILCIYEDTQGNYWFTSEGGVSKYDGKRFTNFTTDEGLSHNLIYWIMEDQNKNIWFTGEGGVFKYNGTTLTNFTTNDGLVNNMAFFILEDHQGLFWIGTRNGLSRYDGKSFTNFTTKDGLINNAIWSIVEDSQQNIWLVTEGGLSRYDGKSFKNYTMEEGLTVNHLVSMIEDQDQNFWIGTRGGGLIFFDGTSFTYITPKEGLSHHTIWYLAEGSQKNIWLGTGGRGVNRLRINSFNHLLDDLQIVSLMEDNKGILWLGTNRGLAKYDGINLTQFTREEGLISDTIQGIFQDHQGNIWLGTEHYGVSRFDGHHFTNFTTKEGLGENSVGVILEDQKQNIWFGGTLGILTRYDGEYFTHFTVEDGLTNHPIMSIKEDPKGNIWFGTLGGGLTRYDGKSFTRFTTKEGLSENEVQCVFSDSLGNIWAGTNWAGLNYYDGKKINHFTTADGLPHNNIKSIIEDKNRNIWVSTESGLGVFVFALNHAPTEANPLKKNYKFFTYKKADGLPRLDFNIDAVCINMNNQIWWGAIDGLTTLDLNRFELPHNIPTILLNTIEIKERFIDYRNLNDETYRNSLSFGNILSTAFNHVPAFENYPSTLSLPYELNHLTFRFTGSEWNAPHQIMYSYKMEGLENEWTTPSSDNKADYRSLPYGDYTFKVKAMGAAQKWSSPFEYTFSILPPWWHTWWAYIFYSLLILVLAYSSYRFLLSRKLEKAEAAQLKEINTLKNNLYTNITHEFRTPLTVILGMAEDLETKATQIDWKDAKQPINMIQRNGQNLLKLVNKMLDLAKLESGHLALELKQGDVIPFIKYLSQNFQSHAERQNINLTVFSVVDELIMDYDADKLAIIVTNLISNAIKFTPKNGEIFVQLKQLHTEHQNFFLIKIKDTGKGISKKEIPFIFDRFYQADNSSIRQYEGTGIGLALTKELVGLMNGNIKVKSKLGKGSTFLIQLPISRNANLAASLLPVITPQKTTTVDKVHSIENGFADLPLVLIIEDNLDVAFYLQTCLNEQYQTLHAKNGSIGIEMALEHIPDLIISDVMMPEKDGFEVCQILKIDERTNHIPIIMLTAKATLEDRLIGLSHGADVYLSKPFEKKELLIRLNKLLELRQLLQQKYSAKVQITTPTSTPIEIEDPFIIKAKNIIFEKLENEDFSSNDLAQSLFLSRSQVHRKLKALTGMSTTIFIRHIRLQEAVKLLQSTSLPISEVGYRVGFKSPVYFSQVFKETYGVSPIEIRN